MLYEVITEEPDTLTARTHPLENSISPVVQEIIIDAYSHLPASHADAGISWLLESYNFV